MSKDCKKLGLCRAKKGKMAKDNFHYYMRGQQKSWAHPQKITQKAKQAGAELGQAQQSWD